jgi:streptomycin 6-kinase
MIHSARLHAMAGAVEVSDSVRRKAVALGDAGARWMEGLPATIARFEERWQIEVGAPFGAGSAAYVASATTADGVPAVLKLAMPDGLEGNGAFAQELRAVRQGQGRGYADLFEFDEAGRAMLLERLGRPMNDLGLPIEAQIDAIAATVAQGWQRPDDPSLWRTGAEQAEWLERWIGTRWDVLDRPCPEPAVRLAQEFARRRCAAFDDLTAVAIHGDAHPWNVLESPRGGYKLIDPDGMWSEPAHDLAIPLRHWNDELLAQDASATLRSWCARLQETTGVDAQAIWEWAHVERVSTGLFLLSLGDPIGLPFLEVAGSVAA